MNKPIIDPSILSDEQREAIREKYNEIQALNSITNELFENDTAIFKWLFGKEFFEKGEINE